MLFRQIERLARCRRIDRLVVTTSTDPSDDPLVVECARRDIPVHRDSLFDVLGRFASAARVFRPDIVVRLTGDCPLADWELIDQAIDAFQAGGYDYLTNAEPPTYPDGLDVEVVSEKALLDAAVTAVLAVMILVLLVEALAQWYAILSRGKEPVLQETPYVATQWAEGD